MLIMIILPDSYTIYFNAVIPGAPASGTKLDTAYIEFINGGTASQPEFEPGQVYDYFAQLAATPDRDYLRVPIMSHTLGKQEETGFAKLTLLVSTDGDTGVHGKLFSAAVGSRIYGLAIGASQTNDRGDLLMGYQYYAPEQQTVLPENAGIVLTVELLS
jgi:hypothetical protein